MFTICVPTIRPHTLSATVASVLRQTRSDWQLLIVSQGSDPGLRDVIAGFTRTDARISTIHLDEMGLSKARNAALRVFTTPLIVFLDDDCEAREDWLEAYATLTERWPDVGLIGGAVVAPPKAGWRFGMCPRVTPAEVVYDPLATPLQPPPGYNWLGANFLLRRGVVERIGGFDELLGAGAPCPAGEDYDYKVRMEMLGLKMGSTPNAVVYHTYGWRYGLRAAARHAAGYAAGEGAVSAKLMQLDAARGAHELKLRRQELRQALPRPQRLPKLLWRQYHYWRTYRAWMAGYRVDPRLRTFSPT